MQSKTGTDSTVTSGTTQVAKTTIANIKSAAIKVLHITDSHLSEDPEGSLLGVNTRDSLDAVLTRVAQDAVDPDYILATGDLAQDASKAAYEYFQSKLESYACPKSWFAGNHDDRSAMASVVAAGQELRKVVRIGTWQFVLLDSSVPGKTHGFLEQSELDVLDAALAERPDLHTLVCLHHHPIAIDSRWLDRIGLHNRDAFLSIIDNYSNVRAILWGHIHQQLDQLRGDVNLYATPSTCIQFLPKSDDFAVEDVAPGYRWLHLYDDGSIDTVVKRAEQFKFDIDMTSSGY